MKILIFSNNAWDDSNSLGNTISNFFGGVNWQNDIFYNIYMRNSMPHNNVCRNYFKIKPMDLFKYYFKREMIGERINTDDMSIDSNEVKYIDLIHKKNIKIIYPIMEYIYRRKKWLNYNFKSYVNEVNPDIFFSFLTNVAMLKPVIEYIKSNKNLKIVLFIADDVYGDLNNKSFLRKRKLRKEFLDVINMADKIYAISNELCDEYEKIFHKKINLLYKGCSFEYPIKKELNNPLRFVYAGNLYYGRDEILAKIANIINKNNNHNKNKAVLEIYTGATISEELSQKLNIVNSSMIVGKKDYKEIKKIMSDADYNLQVESFEEKQIDCVKYSFSTKIIDCLQSGSATIAIGPSNISSIKYMNKVPGVIVINKLEDLEREIFKAISQKNNIINSSKKIREYALNNHEINKNQKKIREDFIKLIKE